MGNSICQKNKEGFERYHHITNCKYNQHAPIFEIADVAVVADLFEVVPALTKAVQEDV